MANVKQISECRSCGNSDLTTVFDMGDLKINAFMLEPNTDIGTAPLKLVHCDICDLVQLSHTVREEDLYKNYWYLSRLNKKIVDNLESITVAAQKHVILYDNDVVVDIGANDGTLLSFYPDNVKKVGIDPAQNIRSELEKNCDITISDFFTEKTFRNHVGDTQAKVITTIAMFYDLDNPNKFVQDIKSILAEDGVWICQLMTARPMLDTNDIGNVIHEHIEYYSYKALVNLFERNGLEIYDLIENDINGGSYQLYIRHLDRGSMDFEEDCSIERYNTWKQNMEVNREQTMSFLRGEVASGKKVYIMGASTKGNTIMQYYGLDGDIISGAAEIHPDKIGKYLVGSSIPIVHEDEAKEKADYFLVFPFHFKDIFVNKILKDWIEQGGKLVFCTPEFEVVG
jgi:NDP-4-keto-2,6-dideoxyhexose 3-C-methyltransferase